MHKVPLSRLIAYSLYWPFHVLSQLKGGLQEIINLSPPQRKITWFCVQRCKVRRWGAVKWRLEYGIENQSAFVYITSERTSPSSTETVCLHCPPYPFTSFPTPLHFLISFFVSSFVIGCFNKHMSFGHFGNTGTQSRLITAVSFSAWVS
jgi:hypothetical protein